MSEKRTVSDEEALRTSICQVLQLDLSQRSGWKECISWNIDKVEIGNSLIERGVMAEEKTHDPNCKRLRLTEASLMRAITVAVDAVVEDLLKDEPPKAKLPEIPEWSLDEDKARLIMTTHFGIQVR